LALSGRRGGSQFWRYRGNSGHPAEAPETSLLTLSGHSTLFADYAAPTVAQALFAAALDQLAGLERRIGLGEACPRVAKRSVRNGPRELVWMVEAISLIAEMSRRRAYSGHRFGCMPIQNSRLGHVGEIAATSVFPPLDPVELKALIGNALLYRFSAHIVGRVRVLADNAYRRPRAVPLRQLLAAGIGCERPQPSAAL
jgi:hypothetical protein